MEGYFNIKVKFVIVVLIGVLIYVSYLYRFQERPQNPFLLSIDCTAQEIEEGTTKANLFFERYFEKKLRQNPEQQSRLGIADNNKKWTSMTEGYYRAVYLENQDDLTFLKDSILADGCLTKEAQLNAQLLKHNLQLEIEGESYRYYNYLVNPVDGVQLQVLDLLINAHPIEQEQDANAYIARVRAVPQKINHLIQQLEIRAKKAIVLPKSLFPEVLTFIQHEIIGKGLNGKGQHLIEVDFYQKLEGLSSAQTTKEELKLDLRQALEQQFIPAYKRLYKYLLELEDQAEMDEGVWRLENGAAFYQYKLKEQTTTELTADEIYNLGLDEVARIQEALELLLDSLGHQGTLQAFFKEIKNNKAFYYSEDKQGKKDCLEDIQKTIAAIKPTLESFFMAMPNSEFDQTIVNQFRTMADSPSLYRLPTLVPLYSKNNLMDAPNLMQIPKFQLEALVYHKAIPGRFMQLAMAKEKGHWPQFRRMDASTAHLSGWGVYAAYLAKEMGGYQDIYTDFGRLTMELWWACCLVVDVGIHQKQWNRQQAIDYYKEHTLSKEIDCIKMVERQLISPAEATAFEVGMITILELKKRAQNELGDQFDIREFHEVLLTNGGVPLGILQDLVDDYIQRKMQES
ncbi:DUF885 domain-containing protein [Aureispira anguillae]|uniref:DUF885 domain-containing protein n=1 Tax=Aureispira anguillae TaxID=2864201 RepID=A0A915YBQ4_9BACT|nr:DUF885 domain-containing protein [Aureispira anguillae]BDS10145.1 DUF885 domain-containing protein [Aureispira anguillae]